MCLFSFQRIFKVVFLLLLIPVAVFGQSGKKAMPAEVSIQFVQQPENPAYILYNQDRELAIKDFSGVPDMSSSGVGATYSGIQLAMEGKSVNGKMNINVKMMVYFDRSNSWMKPEGKDERVLKHEQIHFDLTGIYACKMYKAIMVETFNSKNVKQRLRDIQKTFTDELQQQQALYDRETKHGTLLEPQKAWADKVSKLKSMMDCM
jgi:hypothetical protein